MGKKRYDSEQSRDELVAFHAAVLRHQKENGVQGAIITVRDWEKLLLTCLGTMTRQSCQDKTWALDRLGLIERKPRKGVIILEAAP